MRKISQYFLKGIGSILVLFSPDTETIKITLPQKKPAEALQQDWQKIGNNLWKAVDRYEQDAK